MNESIKIEGARAHNLKNINVEIPRDKLVVVTGLSGSGKSSLAFDTIYEAHQLQCLLHDGQFLGVTHAQRVDGVACGGVLLAFVKRPGAIQLRARLFFVAARCGHQ